MKWSAILPATLAAVSLFTAIPASAQTVPSAYQGNLPFTVGIGVSNFNVDWNQNRMYGITAIGQWHPGMLPRVLYGLGLDGEFRDIDFGRSSTISSNFEEKTIAGGPIYNWHHYRNFQPYAKFLLGYGSINFRGSVPSYTHDNRNIYAPGLGVQYRLLQHVWVRGEYEYQTWPDLFGKNFHPQGFTLGASYDFRSIRFFR